MSITNTTSKVINNVTNIYLQLYECKGDNNRDQKHLVLFTLCFKKVISLDIFTNKQEKV